MKKSHKKRIALFLALALFVTGPGANITPARAADESEEQLGDLNSRYKELEKKQQAINAEINKAKTEKDKQLAVKKQIDNQVNLTSEQIIVLGNKISILEKGIAEKEAEIAAKEEEVAGHLVDYRERMRLSYMAGEASSLELILGAESFAQFLTRAEYIKRISAHDNELINSLNTLIGEIEEAKTLLEQESESLGSAKSDLGVKRGELNTQLKTVESQIQNIAALEAQIIANKAQLEKEMAEVQSEIDRIYAALNSTGVYDGGIMQWPVPNYPNVTSDFGWRFNNTDYHTGIDISGAGVNGKNIVAAADGTVAYVQLTFVAGRGYGRYLIVDHGGGISTLYGHTSAILVKVGDKVSRGQPIALVGSTGWSTGPHLHFEVRVNGKYVNPWSYLR